LKERLHAFLVSERRRQKMDRVAGKIEVWRTDGSNQVVISHPAFRSDSNGTGQIAFSPRSARHLAQLLIEYAADAEAAASGVDPLQDAPSI
jgi:hypothetical protein